MYIYKTEILTVGTKWFSDKADAADIAMLDKLLNERAAMAGSLPHTITWQRPLRSRVPSLLLSEKKRRNRRLYGKRDNGGRKMDNGCSNCGGKPVTGYLMAGT